jgi:hypothetical protein
MPERRSSLSAALQRRGLAERPHARDVRSGRPLAPPCPHAPAQSPEEARRQAVRPLPHGRPDARRAPTRALGGRTWGLEPPRTRAGTPRPCVRPPRAHTRPVSWRLQAGRARGRPVRLRPSRPGLPPRDAGGVRRPAGPPRRGPKRARARRRLHSRPGPGGPERDVARPPRPLERRRPAGGPPRPPRRRVPAPGRGSLPAPTAPQPRPQRRRQAACRDARQARGVHHRAGVQPWRPAWAPPLRDAGVHRRRLQAARGPPRPSRRPSLPLGPDAPPHGRLQPSRR